MDLSGATEGSGGGDLRCSSTPRQRPSRTMTRDFAATADAAMFVSNDTPNAESHRAGVDSVETAIIDAVRKEAGRRPALTEGIN